MNVVDSLVVTLGLDPTKFTEGQKAALEAFKKTKDESKRTADEIEKHSKEQGEMYAALGKKILGLAAAYVGLRSVVHHIEETTAAVTSLNRASTVTGASLQGLNEFGMVIQRQGGNAAQATQEIEGYIDAVTKFKFLGQGSEELMRFMGFAQPFIKTPNPQWMDYLRGFSAWAEKNKDNPAFVRSVAAGVGLSDVTTFELMKGPQAFEADLAKSRAIGTTTPDQVEAARKLQEATTGLAQQFDTLWRKLEAIYEPTIGLFIDGLGRIAQWVNDHLPTPGGPMSEEGKQWEQAGKAMSEDLGKAWGFLTNNPIGSVQDWLHRQNRVFELEDLFGTLENGENRAYPSGVVGKYQIKPGTARQYGVGKGLSDADLIEKLKDPEFNRQMFDTIISSLASKYNGDALAIAYHNGSGAADAFLGRGDYSGFGPETLAYLSRFHQLSSSSSSVHVGPITIVTPATDAAGIARDLKSAIEQSGIAAQTNRGLQ